jgi:hypothetical protein
VLPRARRRRRTAAVGLGFWGTHKRERMRGSGWARITYGAGAVADLHGRRPEQQAAARACVRPERFFFFEMDEREDTG